MALLPTPTMNHLAPRAPRRPADDGSPARTQMYVWPSAMLPKVTANGTDELLGSASFGPSLRSAAPLMALLAVADPPLACGPLTNNVTGKIVVIDRGSCFFVEKALYAQEVGPGGGVGGMRAGGVPVACMRLSAAVRQVVRPSPQPHKLHACARPPELQAGAVGVVIVNYDANVILLGYGDRKDLADQVRGHQGHARRFPTSLSGRDIRHVCHALPGLGDAASWARGLPARWPASSTRLIARLTHQWPLGVGAAQPITAQHGPMPWLARLGRIRVRAASRQRDPTRRPAPPFCRCPRQVKIPTFGAGNATGLLLKPLEASNISVTLSQTRDYPADGAFDAVSVVRRAPGDLDAARRPRGRRRGAGPPALAGSRSAGGAV